MGSHLIRARSPRGESVAVETVGDQGRLAAYVEDAAHVPGGFAAAVAFPRSEREVSDLLVSSSRVLPVGAQSSLTGGATPRGGIVLSTSRLRQLDIRSESVRAEAGVTLTELNDQLRARGAGYPPVPTHLGATIGGIVATNAAGASTFKHGTTRKWVNALTVVLSSGDVLDVRRADTLAHPDGYFDLVLASGVRRVPVPRYDMPDVPKLSAGYFAAPKMDLIDLFIGSEGTLGVVTAVELRIETVASASCLVFVTFADARRGVSFAMKLQEESRRTWSGQSGSALDVSAIEHLDARSLALVREDRVDARLGLPLDPEARIGLLVSVCLPAGTSASDVYAAVPPATSAGPHQLASLTHLTTMLDEADALDHAIVAAPGDRTAIDRLLALREAVPLAVNTRVGRAQQAVDARIEKVAGDMIVPTCAFEQMLAVYESEFRRRGLDAAIWGHISDGNVHPNVIPRSYADVESGREAMLAFGREAIRLGGAPLAEHGVGRNPTKQRLLYELYGEAGIAEMRRVKRALDPRGVLSSGVIFPDHDSSPGPSHDSGQ